MDYVKIKFWQFKFSFTNQSGKTFTQQLHNFSIKTELSFEKMFQNCFTPKINKIKQATEKGDFQSCQTVCFLLEATI